MKDASKAAEWVDQRADSWAVPKDSSLAAQMAAKWAPSQAALLAVSKADCLAGSTVA